ncbi:outer membrane lipoprotein-sorting protein [Colwellia sp. 39_35_sub15_T18]|nr:outer membrane lipoprotein-sorting protein [Colwellia sp. 39_35_sub15_T18]
MAQNKESAVEIVTIPTTTFTKDVDARGTSKQAQKGYDIAAISDRSDNGFQDSIVDAVMVLKNSAGLETSRKLTFKTQEKENETVGDKSLVIFQSPRDVEGTALLSHAKILAPDNQWLFLPALKRIKRISSANKSGPFVGSEFAFEDFTLTELNKFTYKYIKEGVFEGVDVDVIDRFPRYAKSGYKRQRIQIDKDILQPRKLEFFDRKESLLKTLILSEYRQYGGIWRAHNLQMTNHQSGKSTSLIYADYTFNTHLKANDFSKNALKRLR